MSLDFDAIVPETRRLERDAPEDFGIWLADLATCLYSLATALEAAEQRITALEARVGELESPIDGPTTRERVGALETRAYRHAMERSNRGN